jgi:hypothetical protein
MCDRLRVSFEKKFVLEMSLGKIESIIKEIEELQESVIKKLMEKPRGNFFFRKPKLGLDRKQAENEWNNSKNTSDFRWDWRDSRDEYLRKLKISKDFYNYINSCVNTEIMLTQEEFNGLTAWKGKKQ